MRSTTRPLPNVAKNLEDYGANRKAWKGRQVLANGADFTPIIEKFSTKPLSLPSSLRSCGVSSGERPKRLLQHVAKYWQEAEGEPFLLEFGDSRRQRSTSNYSGFFCPRCGPSAAKRATTCTAPFMTACEANPSVIGRTISTLQSREVLSSRLPLRSS